LREPDVDRLPHPALSSALRRIAAPMPVKLEIVAWRPTGPAALPAVDESLSKTLQFENQGLTLRPHAVGRRFVAPARLGIVETSTVLEVPHR